MTFSEYQQEYYNYTTITTFWSDFAIADRFGIKAVKSTFNSAFRAWKDNVEYLTELVLVLNHRLWMHYNAGYKALALVYDEIWRKAHDWACKHLKGEDAAYYYRITD